MKSERKRTVVITSPTSLQRSPLQKKNSCTAAAQTETTPGINPELCIWLALSQAMQIKQSWPHAETQERQLNAYPDMAPTPNHPAGWGKCSCFPTAPNKIHLTISPCYMLKNSYSCLASGTAITECGRDWTLLKLGTFRKDLGASFFPPIEQESAILQKWFAFPQPSHFSYQRGVRAKTHMSLSA